MDAAPTTTAAEPTVYRIPEPNVAPFHAKLGALAKRAGKLGVPAPVVTPAGIEVVEDDDGEGMVTVRAYHLFTVTGEAPRFAGWTLRAVIDRDLEEPDAPNIVNGPTGAVIDPAWRTLGDVCDHCPGNTARGRKTIVAVEHEDGTVKLVGTTCLRDFLGHTAPVAIASWFELLAELDATVRDFEAGDLTGGFAGDHRYRPVYFLSWVAACIAAYGWTPRSRTEFGGMATADSATICVDQAAKGDTYGDGTPLPDRGDAEVALAEAALGWAQELPVDSGNDYLDNVAAVARKSGWRQRDLGLGASIVSAYQREVERVTVARAAQAASTWVGTVGKRSTFVATVTRVRTFEGYAYNSPTGAYVGLVTDEGALLEWRCSNVANAPEQGATVRITGSVKEHGTAYQSDAPLTKLTRCKWEVAEAVTA